MEEREVLQALFSAPLQKVTYMEPGYSGHASDVWLVETEREEAVVRASRWHTAPDNEFWWGCWRLFGLDPRQSVHMEAAAWLLAGCGPIACPRILRRTVLDGREYVVVQRMPGEALQSFSGQPSELLREFGRWLASVHSQTFSHYGNPAGTKKEPAPCFHTDMVQTMAALVGKFYGQCPPMRKELGEIQCLAGALPDVVQTSLVLVDMDPTQFLTDGTRITAVVDTEAYVLAPRELDLIGLEYVMDPASAALFAEGYASVLPLPDLQPVRRCYRFLYRLLDVQGHVPLKEWYGQRKLF